MFIHLGKDTVVKTRDVVGIFDLDNTTVSAKTREFLARAETKKQVKTVSNELPKSFVLCAPPRQKTQTVYLSQLASGTLQGRLNFLQTENQKQSEDTTP